MRAVMLLLLMAPAPLWSQAADPDPAPVTAAGPEQQEPRLVEGAELSTPTSLHAAPVRAEEEKPASEAAAQPTMRGFLYQVFLTAVTALITALIWKAVF